MFDYCEWLENVYEGDETDEEILHILYLDYWTDEMDDSWLY